MRTTYSHSDIERFFHLLSKYKEALARGSEQDIIMTSLAIHAASGNVPKQYRGLVNKTYKETEREIPLED